MTRRQRIHASINYRQSPGSTRTDTQTNTHTDTHTHTRERMNERTLRRYHLTHGRQTFASRPVTRALHREH